MSKVDIRSWDSPKEDRKRNKSIKKRKNSKEAKNKRRKKKYDEKHN